MRGVLTIVICLLCHLLLISDYSSSYPLCANKESPFTSKTPLSFCQYNGSVCCNSTDDMQLRSQFEAMNVSDSSCASLLKSVLCAKCDPFSAELFRVESVTQKVPVLCNSTFSADSSQSQTGLTNFCSNVWNECQNVSLVNSLFGSQGGTPINSTSKLSDIWKSKDDFCNTFGGSSEAGLVCFDGQPVSLNNTGVSSPPSGMCLEKVGNGSYLNMVAHPDGSNRVFLSDQSGKIWLATVPEEGSGEVLVIDESDPFLDLTDEVFTDTEFGMMGIAFHPKFQENGRFFASFNCDKVKWPQCSGRCSCNSDVGCDPSRLSSDNGAEPCRYHSVIAEFTANGTSAKPQEVRRIFTMGLPFTSHHGGQILFGPEDGYLYFMMGDGGGTGDPYNFSQNKKSLLGKIMRLDIDNIPSASRIAELDLWGNYSIPVDNPFSEDNELQPEIYALGFRNPWRCSFDLERPSYFLCADVGQDVFEEVDIVIKGGNYGWRVYEGPLLYNPPKSPGGNTSVSSINPIFPVMGYNHSEVNKAEGSASITGGYFYRSMTDPCMYGRYLYADLYGAGLWAGTENPIDSGNFTSSKVPVSCAPDSPIPCSDDAASSVSGLGFIFSFGQDNRKDIFILASNGLYRVVRPSRCNYTCSSENATTPIRPRSPPPSTGIRLRHSVLELLVLFLFITFSV
ncbi:Soluble quinoprotein glucose/sorbosone dehydrogenase [Trema orientale]|uniref:Soluble quinoprotein glucose/sorbosone dehydrogenase n=1 Tax=Trema orientale TaxID=63057 RepID=A0A2P5C170_TREOI|nr:Soluble quinoprotein glucose/sorbosone dehydrogenase [Trema orientale]